MAESTKSLAQNIKPKFIISAILFAIVWGVTVWAGFPPKWVTQYRAFVVVGFLFFIILDLPKMPENGSVIKNLAITYGFATMILVLVTGGLPQFEPQYEVVKIEKAPLKEVVADSPEAIIAGKEVFDTYKCWNCHKVWEEGSSDRGPNLGTKQIGLYSKEYITKQIFEPRSQQASGFEDEKSKKAMPDYYEDDIEDAEMVALLAFLGTLKSDKRIPLEGKLGAQWTWWDDPNIIAEGKLIFEGGSDIPEINCAACHGKDGTPAMTGAFDFRDPERKDAGRLTASPEMLARFTGKAYKDWPDELYADRVFNGIDESPMIGWVTGMMQPKLPLWKAMAYEKSFAFPYDSRPDNTNAKESPRQPAKRMKTEIPPVDFH